ncbi:cytochrome c biogenesis protein [Candidatus Leptofilum sp.]|uniref:cytochrome c biogenesis protein n=1 Tax=Candidatus Leptofilum sp. TaxID=3241576 RepID=UPI003B58C55B
MSLSRLNRWIPTLNWLAAVTLVVSLVLTFFYAPTERTMGNVQRIFYFHVGTAWVGAVAFFVALLAGSFYLARIDFGSLKVPNNDTMTSIWGIIKLKNPNRKWDTIALSSVEVGLVFLTITTAAGSVWGKPAWNTWWLWSPRLTLITVAWLTYAAYFMLRGAIEEREKRARFGAVYVIVAFVTIIMAYISIRIFRDIHPVVFGGTIEAAQGASEGLQEFEPGLESMRMGITLTVNTISFSIMYIAWMFNRIRLQFLMDNVDSLKMRVAAHLQGGNA